jgi:threonyl-tRNA synthetase
VAGELERSGFRVAVEDRSWTIGRKIQDAHERRVPYMLILGDDEEEEGTVSVRDRRERERNGVGLDELLGHLTRERDQRHLEPTFLS